MFVWTLNDEIAKIRHVLVISAAYVCGLLKLYNHYTRSFYKAAFYERLLGIENW